jgi:hypothetical protein
MQLSCTNVKAGVIPSTCTIDEVFAAAAALLAGRGYSQTNVVTLQTSVSAQP